MNRFRGVRANLHLHVNLHFGVFSDFIFFWFKLTNFYFQSPNQKFGFSACCVWVGKGICPGQKLVIRWFFVCFKTFFPVIIRFVEVESCRELCSFKWWCFFFFPPESLNSPDQFQPCCSWVDPSFTFPGAVGGSLILLLDVASLLCFIKENKWIHVKLPFLFFLRLPLMAEICGGVVGSVCKYHNVWFLCFKG